MPKMWRRSLKIRIERTEARPLLPPSEAAERGYRFRGVAPRGLPRGLPGSRGPQFHAASRTMSADAGQDVLPLVRVKTTGSPPGRTEHERLDGRTRRIRTRPDDASSNHLRAVRSTAPEQAAGRAVLQR